VWGNRHLGYVLLLERDVGRTFADVLQFMLSEQARVVEVFKGKGKLEPIEESDPLF
jgi:hypothetical protein